MDDFFENTFNDERPQAYDRIGTLCEEGRDEALKFLFKQQWIQYYKAAPPLRMKVMEEKVVDAKVANARNIVLLTLNTKPGTDIDDFCHWVVDNIAPRSWIAKIHETAVERGSDTQNLHCHIVFSLGAKYCPSEIIRFIERTVDRALFIDSKNFINVVKMRNRDIGNAINYCRKNVDCPDRNKINLLLKSVNLKKLRSNTFS